MVVVSVVGGLVVKVSVVVVVGVVVVVVRRSPVLAPLAVTPLGRAAGGSAAHRGVCHMREDELAASPWAR